LESKGDYVEECYCTFSICIEMKYAATLWINIDLPV
jgi:hypothetical protein